MISPQRDSFLFNFSVLILSLTISLAIVPHSSFAKRDQQVCPSEHPDLLREREESNRDCCQMGQQWLPQTIVNIISALRLLFFNNDLVDYTCYHREIKSFSLASFFDVFKYANHSSTVSLIFVGDLGGDPSSAFGHLVLAIDRLAFTQSPLNEALAFSFSVPQVEGLSHALKLLFSSGEGVYQLNDLGSVLDHYQRREGRELWRYPLRLTAAQEAHLIEVILWRAQEESVGHRASYSFLGDNCASRIAQVLSEGIGDKALVSKHPWPHSPIELLVQLAQKSYLGAPQYLPSKAKRALGLYQLFQRDTLDPPTKDRLNVELQLARLEDDQAAERAKRLALLSTMSPPLQRELDQKSKPQIVSESPPPHLAYPYPRLKLGYNTAGFLEIEGRWRGQEIGDRSGRGQLIDREWSVLTFSTQLRSFHTISKDKPQDRTESFLPSLSLKRLRFFEINQRSTDLNKPWSWSLLAAYESGPYLSYSFGSSWRSYPMTVTHPEGNEFSYKDPSGMFLWRASPPQDKVASVLRQSILGGMILGSCAQWSAQQMPLCDLIEPFSPIELFLTSETRLSYSPYHVLSFELQHDLNFVHQTSLNLARLREHLVDDLDWRAVSYLKHQIHFLIRPILEAQSIFFGLALYSRFEGRYRLSSHQRKGDFHLSLGLQLNR